MDIQKAPRSKKGRYITIGAIVTLFVMMQITGRIQWRERLAQRGDTTASPPAASSLPA